MTLKFKCKQDELYTAVKMGWNACEEHLAKFTGFKARYTPDYIAQQRSLLNSTLALPDNQTRNEISESLRIKMVEQAVKCRGLWRYLKRYIADAYSKKLQKPKLEAAGSDKYVKASRNNWDSLQALMQTGSNFIATNLAELSANMNMPATFPDIFNAAKTEFDALHQQFLASEEHARLQAQNKQIANNKLYTELMNMLFDGQEIFRNDEALIKQFTFSDILYRISGSGTAGVYGLITDQETTFALDNVVVRIVNSKITAQSNDKGKYKINQLAAGVYSLKFEKTGYLTKIIENWEVKIGTKSKLHVTLMPID